MTTRRRLVLIGGLLAVGVLFAISKRVASVTMTDRYEGRILYACHKGRIHAFTPRSCEPTWLSAAEYHLARLRHRRGPGPGSQESCGSDEAVYEGIIRADFWGLGPPIDAGKGDVVLLDSTKATVGPPNLWSRDDLLEALWTLGQETLDDFLERNRTTIALREKVLGSHAVVMPDVIADSLRLLASRGEDYFPLFYAHYPNAAGFFRLSRPGLSPDRRQALIEVGWTKKSLHGRGLLMLLSCTNGTWMLADTLETLIS